MRTNRNCKRLTVGRETLLLLSAELRHAAGGLTGSTLPDCKKSGEPCGRDVMP